MTKNKVLVGAGGGGKGGGSQHTPVEAVDSLRSRSYARLIDAVSEGEIVGLVDGFKSIYFDDVPVQNSDGSYNFKNCGVSLSNGSIGQPYLSGSTGGTESTQNISVALKYNVPNVRSIVNAEADFCRILIATGQMVQTNTSNGDSSGTSVEHKIEYRSNGGAWQLVKNDIISGKTTSGYEREIGFALAGIAPWDIRVTRLTADSISQALANQTQWSSITSVIEEKLRYPGTALIGIQIDAEQFSGIPRRAYDIKGIVVKVPSNYDPITHTYSGSWNGAFKMAWTDNPAWCMYDLLTNKRYGLGSRIDVAMLDKWKLYEIGKYCDEPVSNGHGGTEPRFTCNLYIQSRQEAYKLIQDMATIFRGISYWASGSIVVAQDSPQPIRYQFNNTNVEGGIFERAGSNIQTRHNVALVTWNDPTDMYRQKIEYVEDFAAIEKMGYVSEAEVVAFGCSSQGQARRYGEWLLYTELYESEVLTFATGMEGNIPLPNDIIQVSDVYHAGERNGGRVLAGSTTTSVVLDAAVTLVAGKAYTLSVVDVNGAFRSSTVSSAAGTVSTLTVSAAFPQTIAENSTWILSSANLVPETMRVVGIEEVEAGKYKIACLASNPSKFGFVERNQLLQTPPTSNLQSASTDVKDVVITEENYTGSGEIPLTRLVISFKPKNAVSTAFFVEYKVGDGSWVRTPKTAQFYAEIPMISEGLAYTIRVIAGNQLLGIWNNKPTEYTYMPVAYVVPAITGLTTATAWNTGEDVQFKWDADKKIANYDVEIIANAVTVRTLNVKNNAFTYTAQDMKADGGYWRSITFRVRARSSLGRTGAWSQIVATNAQVGALTGFKFASGLLEAYLEYTKPADADFAGVRVWLGTDPNFATIDSNCVYDGDASLLTLNKQANGAPLDGGVTYYARVAGYDTFGKDNLSVSAALGFNVYSVSAMAKDLSESNLAAALKSRIDLVDGSGAGSVNARILTESNNRTVAISAETTNRLNQISTESTNRANAIAAEATTRANNDAQLTASISTISASTNAGLSNNTAAIQAEQTARTNADNALGTRIDVVVAQSTTDRTNAAAAVTNEATARTNADSALSGQITTLTATVNTNNNTQSAAITTEQTARANADGTLSSRIDSLTATQTSDKNTLTATIQTEASARTNADNALTSRVDAVVATANTDRSNLTASVNNEATARANADSAQASQITTLVAKGMPAGNMLFNPEFAVNIDGWNVATSTASPFKFARNLSAGWVVGAGTAYVQNLDATNPTGFNDIRSTAVDVLAGKVYQASVCVAAHRCNVSTYIMFLDASGSEVGLSAQSETVLKDVFGGGNTLVGYKNLTLFTQIPANVVKAKLLIRKTNTLSGSDSYAFFTRAMFCEAAIGQTVPTAYSPTGYVGDSRIDANTAAITTEQTARANADGTLSSRIDSLTATQTSDKNTLTATIQTEASARTNADNALTSRVDAVVATANTDRSNLTASVNNEATARANADSAQASQITTLVAKGMPAGNMLFNPEFAVNIDGWNVATSTASPFKFARNLSAGWVVGAGTAYVQNLDATNPTGFNDIRSTAVDVLAGKVYQASVCVAAHRCNVSTYIMFLDASGSEVGSSAQSETVLKDVFGGGNTLVGYKNLTLFTQIPANVVKAKLLIRKTNTLSGSDSYAFFTRAMFCEAAIGQTVPTAYSPTGYVGDSRIDANTAAIQTVNQASIDRDSAQAQQIATVQTSLNGNTASIQTQATSVNGLQSQYTVKTDVNGYVAGYGLATTANNGTPQSAFIINADKFGVGAAGKGTSYPFIVDTVKNIIGVNGALVVDGTLSATAIVANSITATKMNVTDLSAISANLGTIMVQTANIAGGAITKSATFTSNASISVPNGSSEIASLSINLAWDATLIIFATEDYPSYAASSGLNAPMYPPRSILLDGVDVGGGESFTGTRVVICNATAGVRTIKNMANLNYANGTTVKNRRLVVMAAYK